MIHRLDCRQRSFITLPGTITVKRRTGKPVRRFAVRFRNVDATVLVGGTQKKAKSRFAMETPSRRTKIDVPGNRLQFFKIIHVFTRHWIPISINAPPPKPATAQGFPAIAGFDFHPPAQYASVIFVSRGGRRHRRAANRPTNHNRVIAHN